MDGDTLYQLHSITGGLVLSGGRIAISDYGTRQIRIFGADGSFLGSFGRMGGGPGEFNNIQVMGTVGSDTLVILDGGQRRTSRYHPEAGFLGQTLLPEEAGVAWHANGMFGDGAIVFGGLVNLGRGGEMPEAGYERITNPFHSVSLDGSRVVHFGDFPGTEVIWGTSEVGGRQTLSAAFLHFGKSPRGLARGDRFALGTRDRYEVMIFDAAGVMTRIVRVQLPPVPVTDAHLDGLLEERVARLPDPSLAPMVRSGFRNTPHAETMPAFESLLLDAEGSLWVEDTHIPGDTLRTWTVFDEEGAPVTRLSLPRANRVLEIGSDFVLAVFRDELDVEYVRSYPLTRG
jgi:hypothetical protein